MSPYQVAQSVCPSMWEGNARDHIRFVKEYRVGDVVTHFNQLDWFQDPPLARRHVLFVLPVVPFGGESIGMNTDDPQGPVIVANIRKF